MNKRTLAEAVAERTGLDQVTAEAALDAVTETISAALAEGDRVVIAGFGVFEPRTRAARAGRNPQTGDALTIPASTVPAFRPAKAFKQAIDPR